MRVFIFWPLILKTFIVKLHIITSFVIFGIIPFTRLMHFHVFPFQYVNRKYQIVIWDWDRKKRRFDLEKWNFMQEYSFISEIIKL